MIFQLKFIILRGNLILRGNRFKIIIKNIKEIFYRTYKYDEKI